MKDSLNSSSATIAPIAPVVSPVVTPSNGKGKPSGEVSGRQRIANAGNVVASLLASETVRKCFGAARDTVKRSDLTSDKGDSLVKAIERLDKANIAAIARDMAKLSSALTLLANGKADDRRGANIRTKLGSISADAFIVALADASGKADAMANLASE